MANVIMYLDINSFIQFNLELNILNSSNYPIVKNSKLLILCITRLEYVLLVTYSIVRYWYMIYVYQYAVKLKYSVYRNCK